MFSRGPRTVTPPCSETNACSILFARVLRRVPPDLLFSGTGTRPRLARVLTCAKGSGPNASGSASGPPSRVGRTGGPAPARNRDGEYRRTVAEGAEQCPLLHRPSHRPHPLRRRGAPLRRGPLSQRLTPFSSPESYARRRRAPVGCRSSDLRPPCQLPRTRRRSTTPAEPPPRLRTPWLPRALRSGRRPRTPRG